MGRVAIAWGLALSVVGVCGCDAALGLSAPTLAPCADGCVDATELADVVTGGDDGSAEATAEAAAPDASASDATHPADATTTDSGTPVPESGPDAPQDAAIDQGPIVGLRCGGGSFPEVGCTGATPICCQTGSGSATQFGCVATEAACSGYPIVCADYNDCPGSDVCCHFNSHQVCSGSCPNTQLVCSTALSDSCPTGWTCDIPWFDGGAQSPYLGCMP